MTNNLTNKLTPYEEFLVEAAEDNTNRYSRKSVQLIVQNGIRDYVYTVPIREETGESELAEDIGAKKLEKYNIHSKRVEKLNNLPRDSDKLVNGEEYLVITNDVPDTKKRIQNYKDEHETLFHANNTNRALDVMNNYKDEN
ncbi:MAG: hypothetical protein NTZ83_01215 [Candidatus Pacearchaeota archaeon]|nr:hypothetical protein [Candidatus Pacearchaeota archaeon]